LTIPAGLTAVEVRGYYVRVDGSSSRGTVDLTPVATRDSASLNLTVVAAPVRVTLDAAGRFARTVTAGDDPDLGTLYMRVDERIDGVTRTYTILVPESAAVTGLDLADAAPLTPVEPLAGYILVSSVGVTVAPLVGGLVPSVHLPSASGGASRYDHTQTTPAATWTVTHSLGRYPHATALDTAQNRIWPDLQYPNLNTAVVIHAEPLAGSLHLS